MRDRLGSGDGCERAEVVEGDARRLAELVEGPFDLCLTSPPYMTANAHPENPLKGYEVPDGNYPTYLAQLGEVFGQVAGPAAARAGTSRSTSPTRCRRAS